MRKTAYGGMRQMALGILSCPAYTGFVFEDEIGDTYEYFCTSVAIAARG